MQSDFGPESKSEAQSSPASTLELSIRWDISDK